MQADIETPNSDEAEGHKHFEIRVNTRVKVVDHRVLTFDEVVALAFPDGGGPNVIFSVTYSHAAGPQHEGILGAGGEVKIKNGTVFDVTKTDKS